MTSSRFAAAWVNVVQGIYTACAVLDAAMAEAVRVLITGKQGCLRSPGSE